MFRKKDSIDIGGVNDIVFLGKNILKLLFIVLIIGIVLGGFIFLRELGLFSFLGNVISILSPLFIGFIIAWLFSPLVNSLTKKGMSRMLASVVVYACFIAFLVMFFWIFIPIIYKEINELITTLPGIMSKITDWINGFFDSIKVEGVDIVSVKENVLGSITAYTNNISSNLPTTIVTYMSTLFSGLGTIFFGLIIGIYMLFDFDSIAIFLLKLLPDKYEEEISNLLIDIGVEVRKCVNGTLLVACMVFVCDTVGFSIVGLESALLFGLFCGITDLIPYIGPWLGTAVATIVGLTESPLVGLGVLIIAVIVQLVESYILQPVVMSKATNLHPVTIICGLLIFGYFFGVWGMILATPIMSIFKVIWKFIKKKFNIFGETIAES